jgi:hypothetical protein
MAALQAGYLFPEARARGAARARRAAAHPRPPAGATCRQPPALRARRARAHPRRAHPARPARRSRAPRRRPAPPAPRRRAAGAARLALTHPPFAPLPQIAKRRRAHQEKNPSAKIISLGIGDTTEPIPAPIAAAMEKAAAGLGTVAGYSGYGAEQGQGALRQALADAFYPKGLVAPSELFVSDGSKCDLTRLQIMFGAGKRIALQDPSYPAYVDSSVIIGQTNGFNAGTAQYGARAAAARGGRRREAEARGGRASADATVSRSVQATSRTCPATRPTTSSRTCARGAAAAQPRGSLAARHSGTQSARVTRAPSADAAPARSARAATLLLTRTSFSSARPTTRRATRRRASS